MTADGRSHHVPGDALLHPLAVAAVAILLLNDHVMKQASPGWFTGKASDFAGLIFFPLLAISLYEVAFTLLRKPIISRRNHLNIALLVTGFAFALVKLIPAIGGWYSVTWGWLSAPLHGSTAPVALVQDPTDLLTLPALGIALWIGRARLDAQEPSLAADPASIAWRAGRESNPQPSDP
jgi:hypothetical protein